MYVFCVYNTFIVFVEFKARAGTSGENGNCVGKAHKFYLKNRVILIADKAVRSFREFRVIDE